MPDLYTDFLNLNISPLGKTTIYVLSPQKPFGGCRFPFANLIPRSPPESLRYLRPHAPGNWADNDDSKSVPSVSGLSSSAGISIGSSFSSSVTRTKLILVTALALFAAKYIARTKKIFR